MSRRSRKALLTAHIALSVGLLGDSAGFAAVALRARMSDDPAFTDASYALLRMFSLAFGIPLSFGALLTGLALTVGTRWSVRRQGWVAAKLGLIVSVVLVGALVIDRALDAGPGDDSATVLIAAASYDVLALLTATALAVHKPRRRVERPAAAR